MLSNILHVVNKYSSTASSDTFKHKSSYFFYILEK